MRRGAVAWGVVVALAAASGALIARPSRDHVECGAGFIPRGPRCVPADGCPSPLVLAAGKCVAPQIRVAIPRTRLIVGPSDWEAEGKVRPRTVEAGPFWIDAFEATQESFAGHDVADPVRAAHGISRKEAADYCRQHQGRLPTEDEWMVAAAGPAGTRYPWGETGAVCRRAAFGLSRGPCSAEGTGPDTVGAHPTGDTSLGVHDLAGNVAEWVTTDEVEKGVTKGGSWRAELETELRVWARLEIDADAHDDRVGVRCAHDAP